MLGLRVAHLVPALFGPRGVVGGAERYALELAQKMSERTPTRLVTFGDFPASEHREALEIFTMGPAHYVRGQRTNPVARQLLSAVYNADVIHCHQTHVLSSSLAALLSRLTGRRVFATDLGGGGWDVSAYVSTDRWFHGHLHISGYSRRIAGHEGQPWAHVISGGVDADRFSPDPSSPRAGVVLFVGRVLPHKGLDDLVEALPPHHRLEIIGPSPDAAYATALRQRAAGKQVHFRGCVPEDELIQAYRRAACVVLPSVYRTRDGQESRVPELLGQTLLEGMACETPAVCTSVASLPEVVEHGVTGLVVAPREPGALREALQWYLDRPSEAAAMGRRARQAVVDRFSWPRVVERCLRHYNAPHA